MSNSTYFVQECPTCGRRLKIHVEHLGKRLVCQHCHGQFEASGTVGASFDCPKSADSLLRRAEKLLESTAGQEGQARAPYPR